MPVAAFFRTHEPMSDSPVTASRRLLRLPAQALLGAIRLYQRFLSPAKTALLGPACGCRFHPTCSHYAADALRAHGVLAGLALSAIRLLKCTPLHPGGGDPVPATLSLSAFSLARSVVTPPRSSARPVCHRT